MSRRTKLLQELIKSDKFGEDKENEQKFIAATAELILTDMINIAINGFKAIGPGVLIINLSNDSSVYMSGTDIERDLVTSESHEDNDVTEFLRSLIQRIDKNDWTKNLLITLISNVGTRTFAVEAGGSQECFNSLAKEFTG